MKKIYWVLVFFIFMVIGCGKFEEGEKVIVTPDYGAYRIGYLTGIVVDTDSDIITVEIDKEGIKEDVLLVTQGEYKPGDLYSFNEEIVHSPSDGLKFMRNKSKFFKDSHLKKIVSGEDIDFNVVDIERLLDIAEDEGLEDWVFSLNLILSYNKFGLNIQKVLDTSEKDTQTREGISKELGKFAKEIESIFEDFEDMFERYRYLQDFKKLEILGVKEKTSSDGKNKNMMKFANDFVSGFTELALDINGINSKMMGYAPLVVSRLVLDYVNDNMKLEHFPFESGSLEEIDGYFDIMLEICMSVSDINSAFNKYIVKNYTREVPKVLTKDEITKKLDYSIKMLTIKLLQEKIDNDLGKELYTWQEEYDAGKNLEDVRNERLKRAVKVMEGHLEVINSIDTVGVINVVSNEINNKFRKRLKGKSKIGSKNNIEKTSNSNISPQNINKTRSVSGVGGSTNSAIKEQNADDLARRNAREKIENALDEFSDYK